MAGKWVEKVTFPVNLPHYFPLELPPEARGLKYALSVHLPRLFIIHVTQEHKRDKKKVVVSGMRYELHEKESFTTEHFNIDVEFRSKF